MSKDAVAEKPGIGDTSGERTGAGEFTVLRQIEKPKVHGEVISKLVTSGYYVDRKAAIVDLAQDFGRRHEISAAAVVDDKRKLLGIVVRRDLFDILGKPYGRDVMKHKNVERIMTPAVTMDRDRNLFSIAAEMEKDFRDPQMKYFVLTDKNGLFHGLFTSRDMLVYLSDITRKDIELARTLQMSIVKERTLIERPGFMIAGATKMAKGVGGDFYDIQNYDDGKWLLAVCDVSGKGVAASLVTTSISGMYGIYDFRHGTADFVRKLNFYIANSFDSQKFVTGIFVEFDERTGKLKFYDMGHSYIYVYRSGKLFRLKTDDSNMPMGVIPEIEPRADKFALEEGDLLVLITDGIAEQVNPDGEEYGDKRIGATIREQRRRGLTAIVEELLRDLKDYRSTQPQHDDMTMILLEYRGGKLTEN